MEIAIDATINRATLQHRE